MLENLGLTCLSNLSGQKHFIHDTVHLVEVEHEIQFAHVVEVLIQNLDEVVYSFQVGQIVITDVDTDAKIQASIPTVYDLEIAELTAAEYHKSIPVYR